MFRKHELIPSEAMGRRINVWRYGHFGPPLLVFPSASGMAHEWDANGMTEALGDYLETGKLKLYCTESNVAEAWTRKENAPSWRIKRHLAFERYLTEDLVPFIRSDCRTTDIPIAVSGVSLGAFYAMNCALKFPKTFRWALCMSGRYNATWMTEGYTDTDVYFNNPVAYLPNLNGDKLDDIRRFAHIVLVCGQGRWEDGNIEDTQLMSHILGSKDISHELDLWGRDVDHQWTWWRRQARYHIDRFMRSIGA